MGCRIQMLKCEPPRRGRWDKSDRLFFEVFNEPHEKLTDELWNDVFPNAACIATLLDRLLHHAEVTVIEGDS